jgi:acyl-CoA oxidase
MLDGRNLEVRDAMFALMAGTDLFVSKRVGDQVFVSPDFNQPMEKQRVRTMHRIPFYSTKRIFKGWLTKQSSEDSMWRAAIFEILGTFDHSLAIKLRFHAILW